MVLIVTNQKFKCLHGWWKDMLFGILIARKQISKSLQPKRREVLQRYLSIRPYSCCWFSTFFFLNDELCCAPFTLFKLHVDTDVEYKKQYGNTLIWINNLQTLMFERNLMYQKNLYLQQIAVVVRANFYLVILQTFIFSGYATRTVKSTGRLIELLLTGNILHLCNYSNFLCLMCLKLIDSAVTVFRWLHEEVENMNWGRGGSSFVKCFNVVQCSVVRAHSCAGSLVVSHMWALLWSDFLHVPMLHCLCLFLFVFVEMQFQILWLALGFAQMCGLWMLRGVFHY